jgi:hypothetical protein
MLNLFRSKRPRTSPDRSGLTPLGFRIAPDVKASLHSDGVVLIHHGRGTVFSANRIGATIWNGAKERWSLDRVARAISSEFEIPAQAAQQDALESLAQLAAEGLLVTDAA